LRHNQSEYIKKGSTTN